MYSDDKKKGAADRHPSFKEYYVNRRDDTVTIRKWSEGEELEVLRGMQLGLTPEQIAKNMDRTTKAVEVRMCRLRAEQRQAELKLTSPNASYKRRYTKRRVTDGVIKKRIKDFLADNPIASKTKISQGVQGNQQRVRKVVNRLIDRGELQYTGGMVMLANTSKPANIVKIAEPAKSNDLQYSGGAMFETQIGKLLMIGGLIAGGIWLALIAMIAVVIGGWQ